MINRPLLIHDLLFRTPIHVIYWQVEIIRYGDRDTLKPYCTVIIIALFEALSTIEPDIFNYASMKLSASEMKEQIDMARLHCARSSPIMDAINTCTNQYIDENIFDELSGKLIDTIKHSIGLTTKCLIGQYFITLSNLYPKISSKYVGKWMAILVNTMSINSNRTLRKTYTNVLGTIVRIAKRSSIENLLQKISTWYYQTDNDYQYVCALTLNSISQSNHDILLEFGQQILPLIFLAMQENILNTKDDNEQQEEFIWKNLWIEHTGSSITGIQTYIKGIIDNIRLAIEHHSYTMKIKGARAIQMIGETLKMNLNNEYLFILVELLLKGLYGRVYEGKEYFLRSIETICIHCKDSLKTSSDLVQRIYENILKECKKQSLQYRSVAIRVLSLLADHRSTTTPQTAPATNTRRKQPSTTDESSSPDPVTPRRGRRSTKLTTPTEQSSQEQTSTDDRPVRIALSSHLNFDQSHLDTLRKLGFEIMDESCQVDALVVDRIRRTKKFFMCLARGAHILSPTWIETMIKENRYLPYEKYYLQDTNAETRYGFQLRESVRLAKQHPIFENYKIFCTKDTSPPYDDLKDIIEAAGGKFIEKINLNKPGKDLVCIVAQVHKNEYEDLCKKGVPIVSEEFALSGISKQKLDFEAFSLFQNVATTVKPTGSK
ncbi:unnamed protein product [Rotaria sp. Silwood1]|nr:unnamed protein product [Rotaria sp. Silwood1]